MAELGHHLTQASMLDEGQHVDKPVLCSGVGCTSTMMALSRTVGCDSRFKAARLGFADETTAFKGAAVAFDVKEETSCVSTLDADGGGS
jgi:hypothetical protein